MTAPTPHPHRPLFDAELERLRGHVIRMGELVDGAIRQAMAGLTSRDVEGCTAIIAEDASVNALHREVRELCFTILLTQNPTSCDLRETMSLLHMASELERMGDHCVSIAKLAREIAHQPEVPGTPDLTDIGTWCAQQVRDILGAMIARSSEQATRVAARDDRIDHAYRHIAHQLVDLITTHPTSVYVATQLAFVTQNLERIADRVTNIAEDLVFLETGTVEELG